MKFADKSIQMTPAAQEESKQRESAYAQTFHQEGPQNPANKTSGK